MTFAHNEWLILALLAVPVLIAFYYLTGKAADGKLSRFAANRLLERLADSHSPAKRWLKTALAGLALVLMLLALAGPRYGSHWSEAKEKGLDLMFALDVSRSMLADDVQPNRLERSKLAILDLLRELKGDRVGLVAYAGEAFLQIPLTLDYNAFRQTLEAVDTDSIAYQGTDVAAAIQEAQASFGDEENHKFLVLISDGEDLEEQGVEQAREAAQEGVRIFTVGVGSEEGGVIPIRTDSGKRDFVRGASGGVVRTRLDEDTLRAVADATDGFYVPLGRLGEGLRTIYEQGLGDTPKQEQEERLVEIAVERYQWPLAIALGLLVLEMLITTRRRSTPRASAASAGSARAALLALGVAFVLFMPGLADASIKEAEEAWKVDDFGTARVNYQKAIVENPGDARLHYNLANTLHKTGHYGDAAANYEEAIALASRAGIADERVVARIVRDLQGPDLELLNLARFNYANTLYAQGQEMREQDPEETLELWNRALEPLRTVIAGNPGATEAKYNYAVIKRDIERLKEEQREKQEEEQQQQEQNQEEQQEGEEEQEQEQSQSGGGEGQDQESEGKQEEQNEQHDGNTDQSGGQQKGEQRQDQQRQGGQPNADEEQNASQGEEQRQPEEQQGKSERQGEPGDEREQQGDEIGEEEQQMQQAARDAQAGEEQPGDGQLVQTMEGMTEDEALLLLRKLRDKEKRLSAALLRPEREKEAPKRERKTW